MTAPTEAKNLNSKYNGLQLVGKCSLRKQQLKAFVLLKHSSGLANYSTADAVAHWNALPIELRQHPLMLKVALQGSPNWNPRYNNGYQMNSLKTSASRMLQASKVKLGGKDNMSLLTWMHMHAQYLYEYYRYDHVAWLHCLQKPVLQYNVYGSQEPVAFEQGFDLTKKVKTFADVVEYDVEQQIVMHWADWQYLIQTIMRHTRLKHTLTIHKQECITQHLVDESPRTKLNKAYDLIRNLAPIRWNANLNEFHKKLAERVRPEGHCLGLELEFIAETKSEIMDWCEDDYPQYPWMQFKTDGSINPIDSGESTARYQEWTYFLNGNSEDEWDNVRKTLKAITASGARINRSCGNHVHIDMRGRTAQSAMRTAVKMRDAMSEWAHRLVHRKRANNSYCSIHKFGEDSRYCAINTQCWAEHRTIEVRLGMATLNYHKLRYWVRFLQWMAQPNTRVATLEDFMQSNAPMDLKVYVFQRIMKFNHSYISAGDKPLPALDGLAQSFAGLEFEFYSKNNKGGEEIQ